MTTKALPDFLGLRKEQQRPKVDQTTLDQMQFFRELWLTKEGLVLAKGDPGNGKTTWLAWCAWVRKKLYGYPVVSNVPLYKGFGDYTYLDTVGLVEEFLKVNKAVDKAVEKQKKHSKLLSKEENEAAESAWVDSGVNLYKASIIWDESVMDLDKRRGMSKKLILMSYLVQQRRHFQCLLMLAASDDTLLDDIRINPFRTHVVNCSFYPEVGGKIGTSLFTVHAVKQAYNPGFNPRNMTLVIDNWQLFDSFGPVGAPKELLNSILKGEQI